LAVNGSAPHGRRRIRAARPGGRRRPKIPPICRPPDFRVDSSRGPAYQNVAQGRTVEGGRATRLSVTLAAIAALAAGAPMARAVEIARPDLTTAGPAGSLLRLEASHMMRGEFVDWFDAGPGSNNRYTFWGQRFQAGVRVERKALADTRTDLEAFFQFQHTLIANVPADAPGPGGTYFANTRDSFQQQAIFRQGWLTLATRFAEDRLAITGGRTRYRDGGETVPKDPTLRWLKTHRIAERLIGPFDYTFVGRSFDGVTVGYDRANVNATGFWSRPTTGGFEISGGRSIDDIDIAGVALTAANPPNLDPTDARLFWIYYDDARDVVRLDNRPLSIRTLAAGRATTLHTIGANAAHVFPLGPGRLDVLAWVAGQTGDWQRQDHRAWAYDFETGYQLPDVPWDPWLRVVFFRSSGDPDATDDTHESFFQILPTARLYAQTPFYNMMNNQDLFAQLLLQPLSRLGVRADLHYLRATEGADFVYFGGGATKEDFFGYGGVPAAGEREIGYFAEVALTWTPVDVLRFYAYYGHVFGGDVLRANFADEDLDYGYLEMTVSF
jgi:hypothetical protein